MGCSAAVRRLRLRALQLLALLDVLGALVGFWYFCVPGASSSLWFWTRVWNHLLMFAS